MNRIRIGTRGSLLALWQANWVRTALEQLGIVAEIIEINTSGDQIRQGPIANIGSQGVFTKEIQLALLEKTIDLAVHSLKDLPTEPVNGLILAATPRRGPHRDAFVSNKVKSIEELPEHAVIGTGSARRKSQIIHLFGDRFQIRDIRGNVETRLRKLNVGDYDAMILAEAGLSRLGFADRIVSFLEPPLFLPAVGQGALGIETRSDDPVSWEVAGMINDPETFAAVTAERTLLQTLRGGCLAPIAAWAKSEGDQITLHARVFSASGSEMLETKQSGSKQDAKAIGEIAAENLIAQGAERLLGRTSETA